MSTPPELERFEKLRDMESFTDAMFNRLVAFQEKLHPAWNEKLPFKKRIKDLPLHNLIFSNPDRDPAQFGPTVAPFYPLRHEIRTIAHCAKQVAKEPVLVDFLCGNGFIGSLIAQEGIKVIGVREPGSKPNQIRNFYDPERFELREMPVGDMDFPYDVAFSAWMPSGTNLTSHMLRHQPKLVVYVFTDHVDNQGQRQTGTEGAFTDLPENYQVVAEWSITRPRDILHEAWPDLTPSIEETRHVRIFADAPYHHIDVAGADPGKPYDWEGELDMALLALEAKEYLRNRGINP